MLLFDPLLSSDIYRYVWDGRVQAAGINPYRYFPAHEALAFLRDGTIFPHINRAEFAVTIYPPVAQFFFFVVTRIGESVTVMRFALLGCTVSPGFEYADYTSGVNEHLAAKWPEEADRIRALTRG